MYDHLAQKCLISGAAVVRDLYQSSVQLLSPLWLSGSVHRPPWSSSGPAPGGRQMYKEFTRITSNIIPSTFQCVQCD